MKAMLAAARGALGVLALIAHTACGGAQMPARDTTAVASAPPAAAPPDTASPDAADEGRAPTASEARTIESLLSVAEHVRGLRFTHAVRVRVQDSVTISESLSREMEEEDLLESRDLYVALGLLAPDVDVRTLLLRVLGEQVVGYYDTKHKYLVVRDDVLAGLVRARQRSGAMVDEGGMVLVHELVHALQDQTLGLGASYEAERSIDEGNAFHALVEGDATLAMIGYLAERAGGDLDQLTNRPDVLRAALDSGPAAAGSTELLSAPPIVRVPLLSAYFDGLLFCASLHARGRWSGVNRAYRSLPASSEQVLHPERFARNEPPESVTVPALPELTDAGVQTVREDTIGELELGVYFGLGLPEADAKRAADGWAGDRVRILRSADGTLGAVWLTRWDSEPEAIEAEGAAQRVMDAVLSPQRASFAVARHARDVLLVRGLRPELHAAVLAAFTSVSAE